MKKVIFITIISLIIQEAYCNNGGGIAAGVLGGFGAGAIIGAAASSRRRSPDVVYVNDSRPYYGSSNIQNRRLEQWEQDLQDKETELIAWERDLKRREKRSRKGTNLPMTLT